MEHLKNQIFILIIALCCFGMSIAQDDSSDSLITPVLDAALPTSQEETTVNQIGSESEEEKSGRSFLPQGLAGIFQQKPKQPTQTAQPASQATTQTTATTQQQATQVDYSSLKEGIEQGNLASDFRLLNLEGQTVQLASLRGKPVIINFWGINCPPCIEELPILQKADREINGQYRGLTGSANAYFLLVALKSNTEETKPFLDELGIEMNTLIEATIDQASNLPYEVHDTESVFRKYRAFGLPTTFLVDPTGVIQSKRIGAFVNEDELSHYLKSVGIVWQPM